VKGYFILLFLTHSNEEKMKWAFWGSFMGKEGWLEPDIVGLCA